MMLFTRLHRKLDPAETLGELIFGLIMVLTFTLGARLLGPAEPIDGRELLVAAIGCNIAWGIIDAFLFLLGRIFERRRIASLTASLREAQDEGVVTVALDGELRSGLTDLSDPGDRRRFYASIAEGARRNPPTNVRLTLDDLRGAGLVCCLVVATAVPAALPFLILNDAYVALRISNAILIGLLYVVGYYWGRHVGAAPRLAGLLIMSIGVVLVLVAIPLGG